MISVYWQSVLFQAEYFNWSVQLFQADCFKTDSYLWSVQIGNLSYFKLTLSKLNIICDRCLLAIGLYFKQDLKIQLDLFCFFDNRYYFKQAD